MGLISTMPDIGSNLWVDIYRLAHYPFVTLDSVLRRPVSYSSDNAQLYSEFTYGQALELFGDTVDEHNISKERYGMEARCIGKYGTLSDLPGGNAQSYPRMFEMFLGVPTGTFNSEIISPLGWTIKRETAFYGFLQQHLLQDKKLFINTLLPPGEVVVDNGRKVFVLNGFMI